MVDPGTAILISSALAAGAHGIGEHISGKKHKKGARLKAKEVHRETKAKLLEDALNRTAQTEAESLSHGIKTAKRRSGTAQNSADLVREAFNI